MYHLILSLLQQPWNDGGSKNGWMADRNVWRGWAGKADNVWKEEKEKSVKGGHRMRWECLNEGQRGGILFIYVV